MTELRVCRQCGVEQPITNYYEHRSARTSIGYRRPTCKACCNKAAIKWAKANPESVQKARRKNKLSKKYNITLEQFSDMEKAQGGVCYLCNKPHERRPLNVDHCHKTGRVRKLLCDKCNLALGLLEDDIGLIDKIKDYLIEHS